MNHKKLIQTLGFLPKENTAGIFHKKYSQANNYAIEVDIDEELINYGTEIKAESKTTLNFTQAENWVVLECVDRLLTKGYQPKNITLEKTWSTGHGTSGRLDILVTRDDGTAYLMIECKTWGSEFNKELKNLERNGGQLFTYFQQDKDADVLMLYTSKQDGNKIAYKNTIVKIEEDYRQAGNVKDFYERWSKLPKTNGIFDNWVLPYEFQSKALTQNDLKELRHEDSSFIFNRFLEILRHNVVSDKPNAFNKIFTLFLCKIIDEDRSKDEQLHFQWLEGEDNHISFQKRLNDLYRRGMRELLEKNVTDISDDEFDSRFDQVDEKYREQIKDILTEVRLKKNNEFAIKEVYDDVSFEDNAKVVKEVVELLQVYQLRYNYRQQFLSDFFELLLTTGLKQESGQFFTPVPIARFIIKSLPIEEITAEKIKQGNHNDLLPTIIDYAAGSGHFLTESMEIVQKYLDDLDPETYRPATKRQIDGFQRVQFDWAEKFVYGIEKDYRLVKTAKVSCYLHGDGLAKIIHGDGLDDFATSSVYKDLLKITDKVYPQDNKQFDIVISNPPYSVSAFKGTMMEESKANEAFDLYGRLTDQSSEIECLFIERTKQLLKDGGVAGIILPSSILNNTGIYTQTRELGANTFMATNTNTVTLFLRRRNNAEAYNIEETIKKVFATMQDVTINGIEKPLKKYVDYVWDEITLDDYKTLLQKSPNKNIKEHEIFIEYEKKIRARDKTALWNEILAIEQEKLLYFVLAYPQRLVLIKTGQRAEEKRFLGYQFSNRRGNEGIHAMQQGKTIDECTQLYDADSFVNPEKASTYVYKAFLNEFDLKIAESLQKNVSYQNLVDMFTFDRVDFEKNISLSAKKKVRIESRWDTETLESLATFQSGLWTGKKGELQKTKVLRNTNFKLNNGKLSYEDVAEIEVEVTQLKKRKLEFGDIILEKSGGSETQAIGRVVLFDKRESEPYSYSNFCSRVRVKNTELLEPIYLWLILNKFYDKGGTEALQNGVRLLNLDLDGYKRTKIPLPPLKVQQLIVSEIEVLERQEEKALQEIERLNTSIQNQLNRVIGPKKKLKDIAKYSSNKVSFELLNKNNYVGVDNLLQNTEGKTFSSFVPTSGQSTEYKEGDILLSNIRPYLKKIWFANNDGGSSNDVLVLQTIDESINSKYVFYLLKRDEFFNYVMEKPRGVKMPRGDKLHIMDYEISLPDLSEQQKIVSEIEKIEAQIKELEKQIAEMPNRKEEILKTHLN